MKLMKLLLVLGIVTIVSCGGSERVIMDDGSVYEIKSNSFYQNGNDVTEQLSDEEKEAIKETLNQRLEAKRLVEEKKETLENEQEDIEEALEKAKERQEELEANQEQLEEKVEAREDAREEVLKAKEKLRDKQERYETLKEKGKLSPRDETKWLEKLADLEEELNEANEIYKGLK